MKIFAGHSHSESQCYDFCKFRDMFLSESQRFVLLVFFRDMLLFDAVCIGVILHDFWGGNFLSISFSVAQRPRGLVLWKPTATSFIYSSTLGVYRSHVGSVGMPSSGHRDRDRHSKVS